MRKPDRLAGGIVALVVGLLAFGSLHGWAEEEPPYPVERKGDPVTKNKEIDILDEEIVAPEQSVIDGGNITITSRTFEPPEKEKGWRFKSFGTTHVDIHEDDPPDGLSRYVVPPTADNDTETRIRVEAVGLEADAALWPLRCEGNLNPGGGGGGGEEEEWHWSAKMVKAGKIGIAEVVRDGNSSLPYSVSPTKTKELAVTFAQDMVGKTVTFTIEGVNADNGTATLQGTAPITLTQSGTITVQGGTGAQQTEPGHDKQLYVKATYSGQEVGRNEGFSVCAHPASVQNGPGHRPLHQVIYGVLYAGMSIDILVKSDSGTDTDLDEVMDSEVVSSIHTKTGSLSTFNPSQGTSSFMQATTVPPDIHGMDVDSIIYYCDNFGGNGSFVVDQLDIFYCKRCGMKKAQAAVVPHSGYQIVRSIIKGAGTRIDFKADKNRVGVTVGGFSTQAGSAAANYSETVTVQN